MAEERPLRSSSRPPTPMRGTPSVTSSRRPRTPMPLPVIHERDERGGGGGGGGTAGSSSPPSPSSSCGYDGDDIVAGGCRVVRWPPRDDITWPPREEDTSPLIPISSMMAGVASTANATTTGYGAVALLPPPALFRDDDGEVTDAISPASSSSSSSFPSSPFGDASLPSLFYYASPTFRCDDDDDDDDRRGPPRRRRRRVAVGGGGRRYRRGKSSLVGAALFAACLSAVLWLPLLRPSSSPRDDDDGGDDDVVGWRAGGRSRSSSRDQRPRSRGNKTRKIDDDDAGDGGGRPSSWALSKPPDGADGSPPTYRGGGGDGVVDDTAVGGDDDDASAVFSRRNVTFSELASALVPAYFQRTVDLCAYAISPDASSSSSSSRRTSNDATANYDDDDGGDLPPDDDGAFSFAMPGGEVRALRKSMLRARDLLDVFSPVYSHHRSSLDDYVGYTTTTRIIRWGSGGRKRVVELDVESDGRGVATGGGKRRREDDDDDDEDDDDGGEKKGGHAHHGWGGGAAKKESGGRRPPSPSYAEVAGGGGGGGGVGSYLGNLLSREFEAIGVWKVWKKKEKINEVEGGDGGPGTMTTARGDGHDRAAAPVIDDLWGTLRKFLDVGYMLLGDYQDLDRANFTRASPDRLVSYRRRIWEWRSDFMAFVEANGPIVSFYLSLPCGGGKLRPTSTTASSTMRHRRDGDRCAHVHGHSSHLFWGDASGDELPDGNADSAAGALGRLGRMQLGRVGAYLRDALACEYALDSTSGIRWGAEAASTDKTGGGDGGYDDPEGGDGAEDDEGGGCVDVRGMYHNARKELRSFLDELDLFGGLLLPGSRVVPEIARGGRSYAAIVSTNDVGIDKDRRELIDRAIFSLSTMKKMMGDLNDDHIAYSLYKEWNVNPEDTSVLGMRVETRWKDFRAWAKEVEIFATIEFVRDSLYPEESSLTKVDEDGKEEEEKAATVDLLSYTLETFLIERKANPTDHIVLGNDAGDADSIISAITLAYIESISSMGHGNSTPIVSISKDVLIHERPETNLLFKLAGLKDNITEELLFIEDLQDILEEDMKGGGLTNRSVSLVDHNTLNDPLLRFQENLIVLEIMDHHEDEHKYEETCPGDQRIIAFDNGRVLVASTTTLVAERLRLQNYPHPYPASIGTLLLGVILIDSINLDESLGKVTERDRDAVNDLLANTDWNASVNSSHIRINDDGNITVDTNELFDKLQLAKYDPKYWDVLPVLRALASDYKHFGDDGERGESVFGIASILMKGEDFMNKEEFGKVALEFMRTSQISFLGIIFVFYDECMLLHKQLAFLSSDENFRLQEFVNSLLVSNEYQNLDLQLEEVPPQLIRVNRSLRLQIRLFDQINLTPSRKQIGPMLEDYFDQLET